MIFLLSSCSRKGGESETSNNNEATQEITLKSDDLNESNEDLYTVDYKAFYDELSAHGEWIEVTGEELGLDIEKNTSYDERSLQNQLSYLITGVKSAYARDDAAAFFVWKPAPELAVSLGTATTPIHVSRTNAAVHVRTTRSNPPPPARAG